MEKNTNTFTVKVVTDPSGLPVYCYAITPWGKEYPFPAAVVMLGQLIAELRVVSALAKVDMNSSHFIRLVKMIRFEHDLGLYEAKHISDLLVNRMSSHEEKDGVIQVREYIVYKQTYEESQAMKEASRASR